jgi:hypothetical protein
MDRHLNKMENKSFKVNGIRTIMKYAYGLNGNELDLNALIDNKLSMRENWYNIKPKVLLIKNH